MGRHRGRRMLVRRGGRASTTPCCAARPGEPAISPHSTSGRWTSRCTRRTPRSTRRRTAWTPAWRPGRRRGARAARAQRRRRGGRGHAVRVGHALGPAPLAFDDEHARRVADSEFYVRQHHANGISRRSGRSSWTRAMTAVPSIRTRPVRGSPIGCARGCGRRRGSRCPARRRRRRARGTPRRRDRSAQAACSQWPRPPARPCASSSPPTANASHPFARRTVAPGWRRSAAPRPLPRWNRSRPACSRSARPAGRWPAQSRQGASAPARAAAPRRRPVVIDLVGRRTPRSRGVRRGRRPPGRGPAGTDGVGSSRSGRGTGPTRRRTSSHGPARPCSRLTDGRAPPSEPRSTIRVPALAVVTCDR